MKHQLRCWPESFEPLVAGLKTFEFRKNDRNYQVGDILFLLEWRPAPDRDLGQGHFTGRSAYRGVTFVLSGPDFGVPDGYCVLGLSGGGGG